MLFTQAISASVGAGLLAIVVNDDAYLLSKCGALKTIASKPAPTLELRDSYVNSIAPERGFFYRQRH